VRSILSSETGYEICGEATDTEEAIRMARELTPELILLDVSMPGFGGLEAARVIHQELPTIKIIMLSQHDPIQLFSRAVEVGAQACVDKGRLGSDLLATIETVRRDG
jgi:DNA-binding NarL/FixJ family response regulator